VSDTRYREVVPAAFRPSGPSSRWHDT